MKKNSIGFGFENNIKLSERLIAIWISDLVLLVYFISVSIVKKDGDDIIKTC